MAQNIFLRVFGHLSYILGVLYRTISLKPYKLKIEIDGKRIERDNIFVEISNTRYTGKDFLMAPSAVIDDGLLDVILLNNIYNSSLITHHSTLFIHYPTAIFPNQHFHRRE